MTEEMRVLQALHTETSHLSDESFSNEEEDERSDDETLEDDDDDKRCTQTSNMFALLTTDNDCV